MTNSLFTNEKGQALTEFAIFLPIYLLLAFGLIFFAKAYFAQQQVVSASRFAVWEKAYRESTGEEMKTKVKNCFFGRLDKEKVQIREVSSSEASFDGKTGELNSSMMGFMDTLSSTRGYAVAYSLPVNHYLKGFLGDKTTVASSCVVDANAWSYKELGNKSFWGVIAAKIGGLFGGS